MFRLPGGDQALQTEELPPGRGQPNWEPEPITRPVLREAERGGRAHGRVAFAGEHTAMWCGYMNGAIESGHRAAWEIHALLLADGGG